MLIAFLERSYMTLPYLATSSTNQKETLSVTWQNDEIFQQLKSNDVTAIQSEQTVTHCPRIMHHKLVVVPITRAMTTLWHFKHLFVTILETTFCYAYKYSQIPGVWQRRGRAITLVLVSGFGYQFFVMPHLFFCNAPLFFIVCPPPPRTCCVMRWCITQKKWCITNNWYPKPTNRYPKPETRNKNQCYKQSCWGLGKVEDGGRGVAGRALSYCVRE